MLTYNDLELLRKERGKTKTRIFVTFKDNGKLRTIKGRWNFDTKKLWVYDHFSGTEENSGKLKFKHEFVLPDYVIEEIGYIKKRIICQECGYINEYKTNSIKKCKICGAKL